LTEEKKPMEYIVNTPRVKVLDYDALYDMLAEKRIAKAEPRFTCNPVVLIM